MEQTCATEAVWFSLKISIEKSVHKSKSGESKYVVTIKRDACGKDCKSGRAESLDLANCEIIGF